MAYDDALRAGALAFFGDKYGDEVRVVAMGEGAASQSTELCGGTHVARTGDIGFFKIVAESGVAAGVRRVEAVTGAGALEYVQQLDARLGEIAAAIRGPAGEAAQRIAQMLDQVKAYEKDIQRLQQKLAAGQGEELLARGVDIAGVRVIAAVLEGVDARQLRDTVDQLKGRLEPGRHRAGRRQRRQGAAGGRRDRQHHGAHQGRRTGQFRRPAGRRQGRRAARPGHGRRHATRRRCRAALAAVEPWARERL